MDQSVSVSEMMMLAASLRSSYTGTPSGSSAATQGAQALAGLHQHGLGADGQGRLDVAQGIAHRRHAGQIHMQPVGDLPEQPGWGLRHWQRDSAAWGQKNTASMRPPARATCLCILAWMALRVAMSNRPRPTPDWLEATTTRNPPG
jgi:hypothetical protein